MELFGTCVAVIVGVGVVVLVLVGVTVGVTVGVFVGVTIISVYIINGALEPFMPKIFTVPIPSVIFHQTYCLVHL